MFRVMKNELLGFFVHECQYPESGLFMATKIKRISLIAKLFIKKNDIPHKKKVTFLGRHFSIDSAIEIS